MASQSSSGNTVSVNVGALSTAIAVAIQQASQATQVTQAIQGNTTPVATADATKTVWPENQTTAPA